MCGMFVVIDVHKAAELTAVGLHAIQHRAREYSGIAASDGTYLYRHTGPGITRNVFNSVAILDALHGMSALGHIRYSTVEDKQESRDNTQPIVGYYNGQQIAIAHNGNLTNTEEIAKAFPNIKRSTSLDTEYILRLLELYDTGDLVNDLRTVLALLKGSYTLVVMTPDTTVAVRDPTGNRPLTVGTLDGGYVISSEDCAFPSVEATRLTDLDAGKMFVFTKGTMSEVTFAEPKERHCCFEHIYFSHPASRVFGIGVTKFRERLGRALELCAPADADIVVPIPDSANFIAMGYAESGRSGHYRQVISRHHDVGRTFIAATKVLQDTEAARKFQYTADEIRGQRIVLIDDSVVRGTTLPKIVRKLRFLGAAAVHVRIGSPPIRFPCTYGINTPTYKELVATNKSVEDIRSFMGADSLAYLPQEALEELYAEPTKNCYACMTGKYW